MFKASLCAPDWHGILYSSYRQVDSQTPIYLSTLKKKKQIWWARKNYSWWAETKACVWYVYKAQYAPAGSLFRLWSLRSELQKQLWGAFLSLPAYVLIYLLMSLWETVKEHSELLWHSVCLYLSPLCNITQKSTGQSCWNRRARSVVNNLTPGSLFFSICNSFTPEDNC